MKKNNKINLLIITLILSFLFSFNNITQHNNISKYSEIQLRSSSTTIPFIVGVKQGPFNLDPIDAWEMGANNVFDQVFEGLFTYNLSDPDLALIPQLASATVAPTWSSDSLNYTVTLKDNVTFHDGAPFNASAVQWNWERMAWALNSTGTNTIKVTNVAGLYIWPDGTPIVDHTVVINESAIRFILNAPYAPFQALLCFSGSYIQSPKSTPKDAYIDLTTGDIVGTGPFVYDSYESNVEVLFHAFDDYWKGKANITELVFKRIFDNNDRDNALLNGEIHFLESPSWSMLDTFKAHPNIDVLDFGKKSATMYYIGMNNNKINKTFREAISYAINYSSIIEDLLLGGADRMKSPIPEGIMFSNSTFDVPILNLTHARLVMQSMDFGVGFNISDDTEWVDKKNNAPFASFNYTYNIGNTLREDLLGLLQDNLGKIGVNVTDAGMTWGNFSDRLYEWNGRTRDMLELYQIGWGPDYNDPSNYINTMFTNSSRAQNTAQYDGYLAAKEDGRDPFALNDNVQLLMEAAIVELNPVVREVMYDRIQELLITRDMPWAYCYVPKLYHALHVKLTGFQQNALNKLDFYSCTWEYYYTPDSLSITTPDSSDSWETGTTHTINWTSTYSITDVLIELYWKGTLNATIQVLLTTGHIRGSYLWTIPSGLANSTLYQIKITDVSNSSIYDHSDYFEIYTLPSSGNSITVTNPTGLVAWETSTTNTINWTSTYSITDVLIELYWKGTLNATIQVLLTTGHIRGSYLWTIPSGLANSTLYQIKITDVSNPSIYDFSDYFEIYTPPPQADSITVTNPSGIVAWQIETIHSITWTSTGSITNVKIELYILDNLNLVLTMDTPNDGELTWTIPSGLVNSTFYQIRISDLANPSTYDYSDYFAIYDPTIIDLLEEIPGYDIYLLCMIIGLISVLLIKKQYKHFKK